jgi:hypothetical protein
MRFFSKGGKLADQVARFRVYGGLERGGRNVWRYGGNDGQDCVER